MDTTPTGEARRQIKPPVRTNDITATWGEWSKRMWKEDEEQFMGEDYEPIFVTEQTEPHGTGNTI